MVESQSRWRGGDGEAVVLGEEVRKLETEALTFAIQREKSC